MKTKSLALIFIQIILGICFLTSRSLGQPAIIVPAGPPYAHFTVTNADKMILKFEAVNSIQTVRIRLTVPAPGVTFTFMKNGAPCSIADPGNCDGSEVIDFTDTVGDIQVIAPGAATFQVNMESGTTGTWVAPAATIINVRILSIATPDVVVNFPGEIPSGQANVLLDASGSHFVYEGAAPAPAITTYTWPQVSGPAVTLTLSGMPSGQTASFNAPTVTTSTDLGFELTIKDGALTASKIITVAVMPPQMDVDAVLLLDTSGSMGWHRSGSANDLVGGCCSRLASAKLAAKNFIERLGTFAASSRVGVAIFPGEPAPSTVLGKRFTPATDLAASNEFPLIISNIGGESIPCGTCGMIPASPGTPMGIPVNWNGTPTRAGLDAARTMLTSASGSSPTTKSRIIVLLSDGAWNVGEDPANSGYLGGFVTDGIHIYTVGMGTGADNVNHTSLQDISILTGIGTPGNPIGFTVYNFGDASQVNLVPFFEKIMADMVSLDFTVDPSGMIKPGQTLMHTSQITDHDSVLSFTVSWESSQRDLLNFYVLTPSGERIDPQVSASGYKNVTINKQSPRPKSRIRQWAGEWRIVVSYPDIIGIMATSQTGTILYNYSTTVKSTLNMRALFDKDKYFTGDTITIQARLVENSQRLNGANIIAKIRRPETGIGDWHFLNQITVPQLQQTPTEVSLEPLTLVDRKNYVLLQQQKVTLPEIIAEPTISLNDQGQDGDENPGDGIYTGRFNGFTVPGIYEFRIEATGVAANGQKYVRETEVQKYVDVALTPATLVLATMFEDVKVLPFFPPELVRLLQQPVPAGFERTSVVFIPRDKNGNYWGPGQTNQIKFTVKDGEVLGPVVDNLDGSYIHVIQHSAGTNPSVTVSAGGVTSAEIPAEKFLYVDQVVDFKKGSEGAAGANKFADPNKALGSILGKRAEDFVSLGGLGSLTVRSEKYFIRNGLGDDLTVFVRSDGTPEPYVVEVQPVKRFLFWFKRSDKFVQIGESNGETASFDLAKAGIKRAHNVRIIDKSGRVWDNQGNVLSTPGVDVAAIGLRHTELDP